MLDFGRALLPHCSGVDVRDRLFTTSFKSLLHDSPLCYIPLRPFTTTFLCQSTITHAILNGNRYKGAKHRYCTSEELSRLTPTPNASTQPGRSQQPAKA